MLIFMLKFQRLSNSSVIAPVFGSGGGKSHFLSLLPPPPHNAVGARGITQIALGQQCVHVCLLCQEEINHFLFPGLLVGKERWKVMKDERLVPREECPATSSQSTEWASWHGKSNLKMPSCWWTEKDSDGTDGLVKFLCCIDWMIPQLCKGAWPVPKPVIALHFSLFVSFRDFV